MLNASAVWQALRHRPQVILSCHVVMAPAAALIRRTLRVPVAQYLHGYELTARPRLTSFAVRHADANIAVSRFTRDLAIAAGAAPDRVHVIPNGVDPPEASLDAQRDPVPTVLTVGRLHRHYKGHDVMLRALPLIAARVPGVRWVVVGDGPLRAELESLAATDGLHDRVLFAGQVSDAERDAWFRRAQVFAMPARTPASGAGEGFGIVFLEANAYGLPVVAGEWAGPSTRSSTARPACSSIRPITGRSRMRSLACFRIPSVRGDSGPPAPSGRGASSRGPRSLRVSRRCCARSPRSRGSGLGQGRVGAPSTSR